jgi:transposase
MQEQQTGKGKPNQKKVLIGVARKLAVLMHRLWVNGEAYDPLYNAKKQAALRKKSAA